MLDKSFQSSAGAVKYFLFVSKNYNASQKYPLVFCLRGTGTTYFDGTNNFDMAPPILELLKNFVDGRHILGGAGRLLFLPSEITLSLSSPPMKLQFWLFSLIVGLTVSVPTLEAAPGFSPKSIKQLYKDGEFEKVSTQLEAFLKRSDATASREERVLAYKYLAVVYASKPEGKPQAEAYFFRLFDLAPQVELNELYVSSSVNDLFQKTRERFLKEKQSSLAIDEFGNPIDTKETKKENEGDAMVRMTSQKQVGDSVSQSKAPIRNTPRQSTVVEKKGPSIWPWVIGAVVVGGGIGAYVMISAEPEVKIESTSAGTN
jgi:hypothetical protein